jgi:hypothetical protein
LLLAKQVEKIKKENKINKLRFFTEKIYKNEYKKSINNKQIVFNIDKFSTKILIIICYYISFLYKFINLTIDLCCCIIKVELF